MTTMTADATAALRRSLTAAHPTGELGRRLERARVIAGAPIQPGQTISVRAAGGSIIGQAIVLDDGTVQITTEEKA